jgi:hypothetical protein
MQTEGCSDTAWVKSWAGGTVKTLERVHAALRLLYFMARLFPEEDPPMKAEEHETFKQLLTAHDQARRLQRMRERTIETYRHNLWKAADRRRLMLEGFVLRWEDQP